MRQTRFSNMHEIPGLEGFFRKGKVGSWSDLFTESQMQEFDRIYNKRMKDSGLDFNFG